MSDRQDVNLALDQGVVNAIRKLPERCASNVTVNDLVETRILFDPRQGLLYPTHENVSESHSPLFVPTGGFVDVVLDEGAKDELHPRFRRRAFISFQGIPASGLA